MSSLEIKSDKIERRRERGRKREGNFSALQVSSCLLNLAGVLCHPRKSRSPLSLSFFLFSIAHSKSSIEGRSRVVNKSDMVDQHLLIRILRVLPDRALPFLVREIGQAINEILSIARTHTQAISSDVTDDCCRIPRANNNVRTTERVLCARS